MQVRYEKDNKERIPFEHYLEEFAAIDPKEAAARVGVPWHEETQEFEVRMMQKAFLVKWPECTIRKANPFDEGYGAMEDGVPPKIMAIRFLTRGVHSEGTGKFLTYREVPHGEVYYRQFNGRCMMRLAFSYGNKLQEFKNKMEALGAVNCGHGDAGYEFEFINGHRVQFLLWAGDEEFPPSSQILFSDNFPLSFEAEDLAVVGDIAIGTLKKMKEDFTMGFSTVPCNEFVEVLASKAPVPGGGGASALVGAIGTALGNMVGSLTVGKKKYADVEEEMQELKAKCDVLQKELLTLVEKDAEVFEPLSKAYGMPRETEEEKAEKARVMEIVLKDACSVPMEIMEKCCEAIELIKEFAAKGSALAIRDAGVGAVFCKAALEGASLNVYINTKSMKNREYAEELNAKADAMLAKYPPMADEIFASVLGRLK